jgi:hypothetical protein
MKHHTLWRLWRGVAVTAALAALAVPAALARTNPYGPHDPWFNYAVAQGGNGITFITDTLAPGGGSADLARRGSRRRALEPVGCRQAMPVSLAQALACAPQHVATRSVATNGGSGWSAILVGGRSLAV